MVLNGLVPSLAETVELVTHYVSTGHVAHTEPGHGDLPNLGEEEHGCGPTSHHCGCCASISIDLGPPPQATALRVGAGRLDLPAAVPSSGVATQLYRPPIA